MKTFTLPSRDHVISLLDYDAGTGLFKWKRRPIGMFKTSRDCKAWNTRFENTIAGAAAHSSSRNRTSVSISIQGMRYQSHRLAYLIIHGSLDPDVQVDHINGNAEDNRGCNLRAATHAQNMMNAKMRKNNTTGVTGIKFYALTNKWVAAINLNGKHIHLGYFITKGLAAVARAKAALRYHGEFARIR